MALNIIYRIYQFIANKWQIITKGIFIAKQNLNITNTINFCLSDKHNGNFKGKYFHRFSISSANAKFIKTITKITIELMTTQLTQFQKMPC